MLNIDIYSTRAVIRSQEPLTVGLAGGQAHFRFSDRWKNLTKTVVFRQGDITKDAVGVTSGAVIPHEVLKVPGVPVEIGVYGSDGEGKIIIPTVWVATDPVLEGADPMVDASTDPTLPVYQQIQGQVEVNRAQIEKNTPFTVKISRNDAGGYEANTSLNDILSVWHSGRPLVAMYVDRILPLTQINGISADFTAVLGSTTHLIHIEASTVSVHTWQGADSATVEALGKTVADHTTRIDGHTTSLNQLRSTDNTHTDKLEEHGNRLAAHDAKLLDHDFFLQELDEKGNARGNAIYQLQDKDRDLQDQIQIVDEKGTAEADRLQNLIQDVDVQLTQRLNRLEAGGVGGGGSGVHIGTEPPVDETVSLWVNPEGGAESEDAAYYDQTVMLEAARNDCTLNFPCPIGDFHELHIHMTGANAVSQLYMEAGGESTYLIAPQHGAPSGTHIHLMATHERDTMNLDVTTAAYSEHAQPGVPLGTASIGNEAASLRLYSKDGGKDLYAGMEIRAWGVYKTQGCGTLKVRNPETGEWESLKTLRGENGKDGADYILTEEDKQEIAEQAAGLVDVPEYELPVASPDTLGGVQPSAKTDEMTNPVGVDELGGLWCAGGKDNWEQICSVTTEENVVSVALPVVGNDYKYIRLRANVQAWDVSTEAVYTGNMLTGGQIYGEGVSIMKNLNYGALGKYTPIEVLFINIGSNIYFPLGININGNSGLPGTLTTVNPLWTDFKIGDKMTMWAWSSVNKYLFTAGSTFELWGVRK